MKSFLLSAGVVFLVLVPRVGEGWDCSDYADPVIPAGTLETEGRAYRLTCDASHVYLAEEYRGLSVLSVADPAAPVVVGQLEWEGTKDVSVQGTIACLASSSSYLPVSLVLVDVGDTANPVQVGMLLSSPELENSRVVASDSDFAYLGGRMPGTSDEYTFVVVDISDSSAPSFSGSIPLPSTPHDICLRGSLAYVVTYAGIHVVDVSDPTSPQMIGSFDSHNEGWGVDVRDGLAYLADCAELIVVDMTDPSVPTELGCVETPQSASDVVVVGPFAYVADYQVGIVVVDISNPTAPQIIGGAATPNVISGVGVFDDLIVAAAVDFFTFPLQCQTSPVPETPVVVLEQPDVFPNPFNPCGQIRFTTAREQVCDLSVFDARGRRITSIVRDSFPTGTHVVSWDGLDQSGRAMPSGIYLVRLITENGMSSNKVALVR